jgi:1-acyl-sn-glycerol-3-phosphate acyltransferase
VVAARTPHAIPAPVLPTLTPAPAVDGVPVIAPVLPIAPVAPTAPFWTGKLRRSAVEATVGVFAKLARYHRLEVRNLERIPVDGPALLVGNHNGGLNPVDGLFLVEYYRTCGYDRPVYVLAHDILFRVKKVADMLESVGIIRARKGQARELLEAGHKVLVFPGGDIESMRPYRDRHKIVLAERQGFIRLAQRAGAPIARLLNLPRFARVNSLPLLLAAPWGLLWGPTCALPYLPLPAKITVQVAEPIAVERCDEPEASERAPRIYQQVEKAMQATLDGLYSERLFPILG